MNPTQASAPSESTSNTSNNDISEEIIPSNFNQNLGTSILRFPSLPNTTLYISLLQNLEKYFQARKNITIEIRKGFFFLAQARARISRSGGLYTRTISQTDYNLRPHPARYILESQYGTNDLQDPFCLKTLQNKEFFVPFVNFTLLPQPEYYKSYGFELPTGQDWFSIIRAKPSKPVDGIDSESIVSSVASRSVQEISSLQLSTSSSTSTFVGVKTPSPSKYSHIKQPVSIKGFSKPCNNPLYWFGVIIPDALSDSQIAFFHATSLLVKLAHISFKLRQIHSILADRREKS